MEDNFRFPIAKIRNSIENYYGKKYYAITLANSVTYHANKRMKHVFNGESVWMSADDVKSLDLHIKMNVKPSSNERVYALIGNIVFCYKIYAESYFTSLKRQIVSTYPLRFMLVQVYKIDSEKFNGLVLLGKEKDNELVSKLIETKYATKLLNLDFES